MVFASYLTRIFGALNDRVQVPTVLLIGQIRSGIDNDKVLVATFHIILWADFQIVVVVFVGGIGHIEEQIG